MAQRDAVAGGDARYVVGHAAHPPLPIDRFAANINVDGANYLGKTRWDTPDLEPVDGTWDTHRALLERHPGDAARVRNARLLAEVNDLKEGLEMVEEKARAELGMIRPNEILVQVTRR